MIPDTDKTQIRDSLGRLACKPIDLMEAFYDRLFDINPEMEKLFKGDMNAQYEKLMDMLMLVINSLDNLHQLVVDVEDLGKRHVDYGATTAHYDAVGAALVYALSQNIPDWTEQEAQSWVTLYEFLSDLMITGAADYMKKAG